MANFISEQELIKFYESEILPVMNEMEQSRLKSWKTIRTLYSISLISLVLTFLIPIAQAIFRLKSNLYTDLTIQFIVLIGVLSIFISFYFSKPYAGEYKDKILRKIINLILPNSDFLPKQGIFSKDFTDSQLFDLDGKELDFSSEDMIKWTHNGLPYSISEIEAVAFDLKNKRNFKALHTGIFGFTELNHSTKYGQLRVTPKKRNLKFPNLETVRLESPDFSELYSVHSNDQVFARFILNTAVMDYLLDIYNRFGSKFVISVSNQKLYFGWNTKNNLFEADIAVKTTSQSQFLSIANELISTLKVIYLLKIHSQGWSKK